VSAFSLLKTAGYRSRQPNLGKRLLLAVPECKPLLDAGEETDTFGDAFTLAMPASIIACHAPFDPAGPAFLLAPDAY